MKKIILLVILFLNIFPAFNDEGLTVKQSNPLWAQISCPTNVGGDGNCSGFMDWLGNVVNDIGNAIVEVGQAIVDFFTSDDPDDENDGTSGESFSEEMPDYSSPLDGGYPEYMGDPSGYDPMGEEWYNPYELSPEANDLMDDLAWYYQQYWQTQESHYYVTVNYNESIQYETGQFIYVPVEEETAILTLRNNVYPVEASSTKWLTNGTEVASGQSSHDFDPEDGNRFILNIREQGILRFATKVNIYGTPPCSSGTGTVTDGCGFCVVPADVCTGTVTPSTYTLTNADNAIWAQIAAEDILTQSASPTPCHGTMRSGNVKWWGTLQHWYIMLDWLTQDVINHDIEYAIPGSGPLGGYGFADLVNKSTHELYEIKPDNDKGRTSGAAEVTRYVTYANINCPPAVWTKGTQYVTKYLPTAVPTTTLRARLAEPGVILYKYLNLVPSPVVVPAYITDALKQLIRLLRNAANNAETVIAGFLNEHPELVTYIKVGAISVAVGIVVATVAEDIATGLVGIWNDWQSFTTAYKIVRFAIALP